MADLVQVADWRTAGTGRATPRTAVALLAATQLLAVGILLTIAVVLPPGEDRTSNLVQAGIGLVIAGVTWFGVPRVGRWLWDASLAASSLVLGVVITAGSDAVGQMLSGTGLAMLALLAALFSSRTRLVGHLVVAFGAYLATVLVTGVLPSPVYAVIAIVMAVLIALTVSRLVEQLHRLSLTDPLTGALNRRGLEQQAGPVRAVAARAGRPTVVGLVDLDSFKQFNDAHGHIAGDALLRAVVDALRDGLREADRVARFGGDEFVVVLPDSTEAEADAALRRIADDHGASWTVGLATWKDDEDLWAVLDRADQVLYAAKRAR